VIIAVVTVRVMQVSVNQVVDMVTMGNLLVATVWPMHMGGIMTRALMRWGTGRRVGF
tara:strand:- start:371 stop:541 length:171 start_codon:yes stop_codon:yes gene_type:complete